MGNAKPEQVERFKRAARELGCDEDEAAGKPLTPESLAELASYRRLQQPQSPASGFQVVR